MARLKIFQYEHDYCPYCYEKMSTPTKYYCVSCGKETATADKLSLDYRGIPVCDCGAGPMRIMCSNARCRNAKNIIPAEETSIVVIAGMRSSGKSTYLLDIVNSQSSQNGIIVSPKSRGTIEWREKGIRDMKDFMNLDSTKLGVDNFSSVVSMTPIGKKTPLCLSLTDRPGEESQSMDRLLGLNYLYCADYIVLLLDLMNIPGIAAELTAKGIQYSSEAEEISHVNALDNIIGTIDQKRGKFGKKIPFFFGISKWDYIEAADLCPPGFSIGCNGQDTVAVLNSRNRFDSSRWKNNCKLIRQFLIEHNESEIVNKAENYFKTVHYFAFSSYGTPPKIDSGAVVPPIHNPRHIMDPFYRILRDKWMI